jgi:AbrB family looped-hinge helix DNA binding protein
VAVSVVSERGRITIDKAIREELGIHPGDETVQRVEDGRIVIEVVPGRHRRSLLGLLATNEGAASGGPTEHRTSDRRAPTPGPAATHRRPATTDR